MCRRPPQSHKPGSSRLVQLNSHVFVFVCLFSAPERTADTLSQTDTGFCSFVLMLPQPLLCACLGWAGIKEEERRLLLYFIGGRQVGAGPRARTAERHLQGRIYWLSCYLCAKIPRLFQYKGATHGFDPCYATGTVLQSSHRETLWTRFSLNSIIYSDYPLILC